MAVNSVRTPSAFGQSLKSWRLTRGLTQEELAGKAGVSARLVSDLERGVVLRPRRDTAEMVADALDLSGPDRTRFIAARREESIPAPPAAKPSPALASPDSGDGLIGRDREVSALVGLLVEQRRRLVTITGLGGVGKTTLASSVAARIAGEFDGGVRTVELAALRDDRLLFPAVAAAFGAGELPDEEQFATIVDAVGDGPALLVLDNLEHLPGAADVVAELLRTIPGLAILATSREPLRLRDEIEYPLAPLPIPELEVLPPIDDLAGVPAVALLVRRAAAVRPAFALECENARAISEIVTRLDGVPLAIELAAARLRSLTPQDLAQRLEYRLPLLTRGPRDLPDRHQTMAAAIDWSYQLLSGEERAAFRWFAVFDGGARLDAAEVICGEALTGDAFDALHSLAEKHLIGVLADAGETRYRMLETVREYGLERLRDAGEEVAARRAHARWWMAFADRGQAGMIGPEQERWFRELADDHDNLRAAIRWAVASGDAETAHAITGCLIRFWMTRGYLREARRWYEEALAFEPAVANAWHGLSLMGYGVVLCFQGEYEQAQRQTERAREIYVALGIEREIGSCYGNLGLIADLQGRYDEAMAHYEHALERFRAVGEVTQAGYMLHNMGMIAHDRGDYPSARSLMEEALGIYRALGDKSSVAHSLSSLGQVACALGDYAEAMRLQVDALELRETLGDEAGVAKCIGCLAEIAALSGDGPRAAWLLGAAEAIRAQHGTALHPADIPAQERTVERARQLLGRRGFGRAFAAGELAEREVVMAVAVGDRPVPAP